MPPRSRETLVSHDPAAMHLSAADRTRSSRSTAVLKGTPSCATAPCADVTDCALSGGCVVERFGPQVPSRASWQAADGVKDGAPALNGTKARASRDPRFIQRRRKALSR